MADKRHIGMTDIVVGEPLRSDAFGTDGKLLLRKGHIVETERQVEGLLERGLYVDAQNADSLDKQDVIKQLEIPSVLRMLNLASKRLERLLYSLRTEDAPQAEFLEIVETIIRATDLNRDVALGCLHLNQTTNNYAVRHCIDTAILCLLVMRAIQKTTDEIATVMAAALSMNVSMLRLQDQMQDKVDPPSEKEAEAIKKHPEESADILRQAGINNAEWLSHVLQHHENEDGSGYPLGKTVATISQNTRILALADRYCAAVSRRKYRKTLPHAAVLRDVFMPGGKAGDPMLVAYFIKELGTFPPGTFVRLENGEVGVVTGRGATPATPIVHALIGPRGAPLAFPIKRDTAKPLNKLREAITNDQATLRFSLHQLWGAEARL
jgi:HD-GYP domain-containing protein (c-di-GMP phosphodiesterase class II)